MQKRNFWEIVSWQIGGTRGKKSYHRRKDNGQKGCGKRGLLSQAVLGFKRVAEGVIIVILLPQLTKKKSTCSFRNNGTK